MVGFRSGVIRLATLAIIVSALLAVPSVSPALAEPDGVTKLLSEVLDGPDYKHATWGILVVDAKTGEPVFARNPDAMLAPASVTKLFTCAAALITVGPDTTFETAVYQRGLRLNGTVRGDLVLVASGDPTLGGRTDKSGRTVFRDKDHTYANSGLMAAELTDTNPLAGLESLAKQIKDAGVKQIDGEILVDERLFARTRSSGSGPDTVSPIMVNDNTVDIVVTPAQKAGDPAKVATRPETAFFQVDSLVNTGEDGSETDIQLLPVGANQFAVRGRIAKDQKPVVRIYPVEEPALFARALLIESLRRIGVRANAAILRPAHTNLPERSAYEKLPKVATFASPPFKDAVTVTLKVSHNLYASTFPCLVASAKGRTTVEAGLSEERKVLKQLGVDIGAVSFGGGAGGAQSDCASPRATVQLLQGMAKRPEWDAYKAGLPVLGVDGTLADVVKPDSPARGKVQAKTGTLIWFDSVNDRLLLKSKALAGVMATKTGTTLLFAMFVNNVPVPKSVGSGREGKALGRLCEILYENGP